MSFFIFIKISLVMKTNKQIKNKKIVGLTNRLKKVCKQIIVSLFCPREE